MKKSALLRLSIVFIFLGGSLTASFAQETPNDLPPGVPKTYEELKYAIIHMPIPVKEKTEQELREDRMMENFNKYVKGLKQELSEINFGNPNPSKDMRYDQNAMNLINCVNDFSENATLDKLQSTVNQCQRHINLMKKTDWDILQEKGVKNPEQFRERMKNELAQLKKEIDAYNKPDEVAVVNAYMVMDEQDAENLQLIQAVDPKVTSLSTDVQAILVNYYRSPDLQTFMLQQEAEGSLVGKEELIEFTQILSLIHNPKNECWTNGTMSKLDDVPLNMGVFRGEDKDHNKKDLGQFLLGIENPKDYQKIDGYKFQDGDNTYYFYHGKRSQLSEDIWVMAKIGPDGKMNFRYYKFNESQDRKVILSRQQDIKLLETKLQQTTLRAGENGRIYIQAQEGMVVEGNTQKIPIIGETNIPKDKLVIGQVRMAYVTPKTLTQSSVSFDSQYMNLGAQTQPSATNKWSAGAGVRFSPLNQNLQLTGNVRVLNLMLGYADNFEGSKSGSVNYVVERNYMGFSSNLENTYNFTAGRQFKDNRGGVSFSTNFNNVHEIRMVLFLDKKKPRAPAQTTP